MPKKYFFTINLLIKSDTNINNAVNSIIGDERFFKQNVQLILIDSVGSKLSIEVCTQYSSRYPDNVFFVDAEGEKPAEAYNLAAPLSSGIYISYIDNYGTYSPKALSTVFSMIKSGRVPILCIRPMRSVMLSEDIPYNDSMANGTVHLQDTPDKFILFLGAYFFHKRVVSKLSFDKKQRFHYDVKFLIKALLKPMNYVYSDKCSYTSSSPCEQDIRRYEPQYSAVFYTRSVKDFIIPMLKKYNDKSFIMYIMMYLIEVKFALNADDDYKKVLIGSHVKEFLDICSEALQYIDDTVILNRRLCTLSGIDEEMPFRFIRMKRKEPDLFPEVDLVSPRDNVVGKYRVSENRIAALPLCGEFVCHIDGVLISRSKDIVAEIQTLNFDAEGIYIDAILRGCSHLDEKDFSVYSVYNGERRPVIRSQVYTLKKYFGQSFLKRYSFRFFIPVDIISKIDTASLNFRYKNLGFRMMLSFPRAYSKLSDEMKSSYALFGDKVLTYESKSKTLVIKRATESLITISESRFLGEIRKKSGFRERLYYNRIRKKTNKATKNNDGKKIIMFYEDKGINFNGSLLFRYFYKHRLHDFEPYICVRRDSPEHEFLLDKGYDNVLETGSVKAKILTLAADIIFAEDCDPYDSLGFNNSDKLYLRDLMTAMTISIKNYFMTYETAQYNNRLRDNTQMVFCASEKEKENLLLPVYDYDESMIKVTGSALLDAVNKSKEKIILIAPGKRKLFKIYENSSYYRFTESSFFKAYNDLLSDKDLLEACKLYGWHVAVLMPKSIEKYASLFPDDPSVKVYPYTENTETVLLTRASALVTDYSDLQYRFAYLGKSVMYFFPQGLPINSEHKGEGITRNGFGEVLFEKDELCDRLIRGMENNFSRSEKYKLRRDKFFGKQDKSNCRRIYEQTVRIIRSI